MAMDHTRNQEIMSSVRNVVENSIQYLVSSSLERSVRQIEPIPLTIGGQEQQLSSVLIDIIMDVASISDKVKSLLHFRQSSDTLLKNVSDRLVTIYHEVVPERKVDVFAVLEVLATKTESARAAIMDLANQGDQLAKQKSNRLVRQLLGYGNNDDRITLLRGAIDLANNALNNGLWTRQEYSEYLTFCVTVLTSTDNSHPNLDKIEQAKKLTDRLIPM